MEIHPTNTCFDDVLDQQAWLLQVDPERANRQHIVHGICLMPDGPDEGKPFAHAWVEDNLENRVYQSGMLDGEKIWYSCDRPEWYLKIRVQEYTRYFLWDALQLNLVTNHFGPWVEHYREFCKR